MPKLTNTELAAPLTSALQSGDSAARTPIFERLALLDGCQIGKRARTVPEALITDPAGRREQPVEPTSAGDPPIVFGIHPSSAPRDAQPLGPAHRSTTPLAEPGDASP